MGQIITWEGVEYPSITQAARAVGVPYGTMLHWLKFGKRKPRRSIPCEWNGVQYPSIRAAADANWITPVGMWFRIRKNGYTCDDDLKYGKDKL